MRGVAGVWVSRNFDGSLEPGPPVQVVWRHLTWKEYRQFAGKTPVPVADIYEACLIEGPSLASVPAGVCDWIARNELESNPFSGQFKQVRKAVDTKRLEVRSSYLLSARAVIAGIFHYRFEEIDEWSADQFFERLAQAELLMKEPLEMSDPSQPKIAAPKKTHPAPSPPPPSRSRR